MKNLQDARHPVTVIPEEADLAAATANAENFNFKKILRLLCYSAGGFFVFIIFFALASTLFLTKQSISSGIPNNAAFAAVFNEKSKIPADLQNIFLPLKDNRPLVLIVLSEPFDWGFVLPVSKADSPTTKVKMSNPNFDIHPLSRGLMAIGSENFANRLKVSRKIPWWTAWKIHYALLKHKGAVILGADKTAPWIAGSIDYNENRIKITFPNNEATDSLIPKIEYTIAEITGKMAASFFPSTISFKMPDKTIGKEVIIDPSKFIWDTGANEISSLILDNKTIITISSEKTGDKSCEIANSKKIFTIFSQIEEKKPIASVALSNAEISYCLY